ncbi:superinfection immunity protein [Hyphobacterium sp. SN044]|uniref:superinfection immunity protein n=1 Tax=Hyphobacterium sp. SN044 TaxID=2912575 RepID=UPI001F2CCD8F|nr:superinfection immunity protein [Hyphobacterium sp. SN044]MCF8878902.1 superinfection immunity protein [Hyphobacterium sp. SN044]
MEILLIPALLYFIPTIVALLRGHHNAFAIFLTNLLFGWTVIGWLITLIWSTTAIVHRVQVQN